MTDQDTKRPTSFVGSKQGLIQGIILTSIGVILICIFHAPYSLYNLIGGIPLVFGIVTLIFHWL